MSFKPPYRISVARIGASSAQLGRPSRSSGRVAHLNSGHIGRNPSRCRVPTFSHLLGPNIAGARRIAPRGVWPGGVYFKGRCVFRRRGLGVRFSKKPFLMAGFVIGDRRGRRADFTTRRPPPPPEPRIPLSYFWKVIYY